MGGLIDPNKGFFGLGGYGLLAPPVGGTRTLLGASTFPTKKRKAYIAFHYDDIMRVNNVRNVGKSIILMPLLRAVSTTAACGRAAS
jgi:hypothetical protein